VVGGTVGTVVGTILIPVPILGAVVGSTVGSLGGKLLGGVSGIALSKVIEVYDKMKESKIKQMTTIPQLMNNLSPESELIRGLITITIEREEEEKISDIIHETMNTKSSSLYPSLEEFVSHNPNITPEKYHTATQLTTSLFPDSHSFEHFVLTPVPDHNAAEEFASSTDLLVIRWPMGLIKPWESDGEHVLNIDDLHLNTE